MQQPDTPNNATARAASRAWLLPLVCLSLLTYIGLRSFLRWKAEVDRKAAIAQCRKQQKMIWDAIQKFRQTHPNEYPKTVQALVPEYLPEEKWLVCPLSPPNARSDWQAPSGKKLTTSYQYIPALWSNPNTQDSFPWSVFVNEIVPENGARLQLLRCPAHGFVENRVSYCDALMADGRLADAPYIVDWYFARDKPSPAEKEHIARNVRRGARYAKAEKIMPPVRYR